MNRSGLLSRAGSDPQTWTYTLRPGTNLENLYALYNSMGDVTISGATEWATELDGPMKVFRAGALTVNAALTFSNRCRGVVPLLESLTMGASGSISMTGKGAAGSAKWVNQDIVIPSSIVLTGRKTSLQEFFAWIRETNYFLCDPSLFASPPPGMGDVTADYTSWPSRGTAVISAAGCGAGGTGVLTLAAATNGGAGGAGSNGGTGGGGGGGAAIIGSAAISGAGGPGKVWGGGPGGGGAYNTYSLVLASSAGPYTEYAGIGQAAGNGGHPGGGPLIIIVRGNVSLTTGHAITANGSQATQVNNIGGGSAGGGTIALIRSGTLTGTPSLTAAAGSGVGGTANGVGGVGSTQSTTFTAMGW